MYALRFDIYSVNVKPKEKLVNCFTQNEIPDLK